MKTQFIFVLVILTGANGFGQGYLSAVIRLLYSQQKLRSLARKEIVKTAKGHTNISESKVREYLHF